MRIFGDAIDDKIFPKKIKKFTQEEKNLIDKFINSILREDKKSEIEDSNITSFNDRDDCVTEEIHKQFVFKYVPFSLTFKKFYASDKKSLHIARYGTDLISDGLINLKTGRITHGPNEEKSFEKEKVITGIIVVSWQEYLLFYPANDKRGSFPSDYEVHMRTKYQGVEEGGFHLTSECKKHIEKIHFKRIKNSIVRKAKESE